jgi:hypothetical protein
MLAYSAKFESHYYDISRPSLLSGDEQSKVEGVKDAFWILSAISFRGLN